MEEASLHTRGLESGFSCSEAVDESASDRGQGQGPHSCCLDAAFVHQEPFVGVRVMLKRIFVGDRCKLASS